MSERNDTISVSLSRYLELLRAEQELKALSNAGVEGWEWYEEAMAAVREFEDDE